MTVYLDHAATTPLHPRAREAWVAASALVGNASSVHRAGQAARRLLEESRERVAAALECDPIEVVFTSGGTESINLALKGLWWARAAGTDAVVLPDGEHHATTASVEWLAAAQGAAVRSVGSRRRRRDRSARVRGGAPGRGPGHSARRQQRGRHGPGRRRARRGRRLEARAPLHLDAVGAVGWIDVSFTRWRLRRRANGARGALDGAQGRARRVGIGALVVSRHAALAPLFVLAGAAARPALGHPDLPAAAALGAALEAALEDRDAEAVRVGASASAARRHPPPRARCRAARRPGATPAGQRARAVPGCRGGDAVLFLLDTAGVAVSTGRRVRQAGVTEPARRARARPRRPRRARGAADHARAHLDRRGRRRAPGGAAGRVPARGRGRRRIRCWPGSRS